MDLHASIKANEKVLELESDVASIFKLTDDLHVAQADALNHAEEHKYRDAIAKKLDSLVSMEEAATSGDAHSPSLQSTNYFPSHESMYLYIKLRSILLLSTMLLDNTPSHYTHHRIVHNTHKPSPHTHTYVCYCTSLDDVA